MLYFLVLMGVCLMSNKVHYTLIESLDCSLFHLVCKRDIVNNSTCILYRNIFYDNPIINRGHYIKVYTIESEHFNAVDTYLKSTRTVSENKYGIPPKKEEIENTIRKAIKNALSFPHQEKDLNEILEVTSKSSSWIFDLLNPTVGIKGIVLYGESNRCIDFVYLISPSTLPDSDTLRYSIVQYPPNKTILGVHKSSEKLNICGGGMCDVGFCNKFASGKIVIHPDFYKKQNILEKYCDVQ